MVRNNSRAVSACESLKSIQRWARFFSIASITSIYHRLPQGRRRTCDASIVHEDIKTTKRFDRRWNRPFNVGTFRIVAYSVRRPGISFLGESRACVLISVIKTLAPAAENSRAISRPIPEAAAVMNTRCSIISFSSAWRGHCLFLELPYPRDIAVGKSLQKFLRVRVLNRSLRIKHAFFEVNENFGLTQCGDVQVGHHIPQMLLRH